MATGIPPFYREVVAEEEGERSLSILYPIYREAEAPGREMLWLFPLYFHRTLTDEGGRVETDSAFFPFIFTGEEPEQGSYFLFFPFWGSVKGLLAKDEIRFRFFPIYTDTRKDGYEAVTLLWPFISWGEGDGRSDFRILPFYSEKVIEGHSFKRSVLWPFFTWGESDLNTKHPTESFFFFPFYGYAESDVAWSYTFLFPFFSFTGGDMEVRGREVSFRETNLWPFFRYKRGAGGEEFLRIWPFYGHESDEKGEETYLLWPILWRSDWEVPKGRARTVRVVPFLRHVEYLTDEGEDRGTELLVWPFVKRTKDEKGRLAFRTLSLIPFRGWEDFEANYGWLWTIFVYEESENELGTHLLSGLLGYEEQGDEASLRLLWLLRIPL